MNASNFSYVCGNGTNDYIWVAGITNQTSLPDLPRCFQNVVLIWITAFFILIAGFIWLAILINTATVIVHKRSRFNNLKLAISFVQSLIYLVSFFLSLNVGENVKLDTKIKHVIQFFSMILILILIKLEFVKGVVSSCMLSMTWLVYVAVYLVEFRSRIISEWQDGEILRALFYTSYILILIQFICAFIPELHNQKTYLSTKNRKLVELVSGSREEDGVLNKECPENVSSFFSRLTFFWTSSLIWRGYRNVLSFKDLWRLNWKLQSEAIVPSMQEHWNKQLEAAKIAANAKTAENAKKASYSAAVNVDQQEIKDEREALNDVKFSTSLPKIEPDRYKKILEAKTSVMRLFLRVAGSFYLFGGFLKLIYDLTAFLPPMILHLLIGFVESADNPLWLGFFYVFLLFTLSIFRTIILQNYWSVCYIVGQQLRTAFIGIVYRKATKLSASARQLTTVGEIVNLMSVDAQKFNESPAYFHMIWSTPLTISLSIYMLWQILGVSVFAGVFCLLFMVPVNVFFTTLSKSLLTKQMKHKDIRVRKLNEILNGIKVLKLYSWEDYFCKDVEDTRGAEVKLLRRAQYLNCMSAVSWFMTPYLVALTTFTVFILSSPDNILDAQKIFVSLSLFNLLNFPLSILPAVLMYSIQVSVSMKRLKGFLLQDELENYIQRGENMENAFEINKASFSWGKGLRDHMDDIDLKVAVGKLVAVVGKVGSGKSSLLSVLCGEVNLSKGEVKVMGKVAYISQQAWIQQTTIRNNILFNKPYNKIKYDQVIKACSLQPDLDILPNADLTEIGEKGINLSGGQKQRVSLARSLYQDADLYLFDDPLSAVDIHVGNHIFHNSISNKGILKKKTRILVTNNPSYLPECDLVVVLKDGKISEMGSYEELMTHGDFANFIKMYASEHDNGPKESNEEVREDMNTTSITSMLSDKESQKKLIEDELFIIGKVKFAVFLRYLRACGKVPLIILMIAYISYIVSLLCSNLWLSDWSNDGVSSHENKTWRLEVYGALGLAQVFSVIGISIALAIACTVASRNLHESLLHSITRAPMSFFDTTPLGRITNRFSRDIEIVDTMLPLTIRIWLFTFSGVFSIFFIISYSTPHFIFAALPIVVLYTIKQRVFIKMSRQLRRLDSNLRSPIYTHFGETLTGLGMIRASDVVERFVRKNDKLVDQNQMSNYGLISANRWLGVWLELVGTLVVLFAGIFVILERGSLNPGIAGLSLSYALQVTAIMNMFLRMTSDIEIQVVSVERINEYITCPQEAPSYIKATSPPTAWPHAGEVDIEGLSVRYRENTELVLDSIKCYIDAAERIGVVGRTGAGKSSFILALFRIIEASSGRVNIDQVDTSRIGLHQLRSKLTVIPQDPILFAGTLRMNLDPSNTCTDEELWQSLTHSNLHTFVKGLPLQLDAQIAEGGDNFSLGQRQLICLSRALLRKSKVLLFDEATAAVDLQTDALVQRTIKSEFPNSTIITIAHRLSTIIDYDKILVLEKGRMREFDSPKNLVADKTSIFYNMAKTAGIVK